MKNALASISQFQLLDLWEELLSTMQGTNGFGGDTCEIYIYRLMPHTPTAAAMPDSELSDPAYVLANHALVDVCEMFETKHNVRIMFLSGALMSLIPIADLPDLYIEKHRLHLKVLKNV